MALFDGRGRETGQVLQAQAVFVGEVARLPVQQPQAAQQAPVGGAYGAFDGPGLRIRGRRRAIRHLPCATGVGARQDCHVHTKEAPRQACQPDQGSLGVPLRAARAIARGSG
ncbi:hypothetical protein D3C85_799630 [compost metagenome]